MSTKQNTMVTGALILSASSIFVRMIGFVFRIYLSNTMGAEGMGVYMLIMSVYGLCVTVATSGISTAVSRLVAEQFSMGKAANAKKVLHRSCGLAMGVSCTVAVVMFFFAGPIGNTILNDGRTVMSIRILALGIPFLSLSSCLRGYFVACRRVGNPAVGQVLEQLCKMAFIMTLIGTWLPKGIEYGCMIVILGMTVGEVVCFLYSYWGYLKAKRKTKVPGKADMNGVVRSILEIIVPISFSAYIRSALRLVEDVLILAGLKTFSGQDAVATSAYGMLKGMVMPLLLFPLNLLSSFVITLMPEISRMNTLGNTKRLEQTIDRILAYTFMAGIFIVCMFMTFPNELGMAVYKDPEVGTLLWQLSFLCPFMCVEMVVVGILQGLGEQVSSMRYALSDSVLRVVLIYFLIPVRGVGGFMIMVVVSNLFTSILNLYRLLKVTRMRWRLNDWFLKPGLAAAVSGQVGRLACNYWLFERFSLRVGLAIGLLLISVLYVLILFSIGSMRLKELDWIWKKIRFPTKPPKAEAEPVV